MTKETATTRRDMLKCSLWAGTGILWTVAGGVPRGAAFGAAAPAASGFTFAQISDSHIGFRGEANPDPTSTLREALARLKAMPKQPSLLLHTGDVTHLSTPEQFDTAQQVIKSSGYQAHYIPGEHDVLVDDGKPYFERFGQDPKTGGWYSFDQNGVHFIGLINVFNFKGGGLGALGDEQLAWLEADLKGRGASTPIVMMAHMPLWPIYPQWGWGTADADRALAAVKRFGSVTVLNGHIHQVIQKVEGQVAFHTAMSTAFPQAAPGEGPGPGPLKVPAERLRAVLGVREVQLVRGSGFVIADTTLDA
jgi:Icc protein